MASSTSGSISSQVPSGQTTTLSSVETSSDDVDSASTSESAIDCSLGADAIVDPELRKLFKRAMAQEEAAGRPHEIGELTTINFKRRDREDFVRRLDGISCAKSLREVILSFHAVESIKPLASLDGLLKLNLRSNPVSVENLGEISNLLPFIRRLNISIHSQDEDMQWLGELHRVEHIGLGGEGATNRVVHDLTKLARLEHLNSLYFFDVKIDTLEPLLPYSEQLLRFEFHDVEKKALAWLYRFTNVVVLQVTGSNVDDLEWVPTLDDVYYFYVRNTRVRELSRLSRVVNAKDVDLSSNMIDDISPLRDFKEMKELSLARNYSLSDLSPLRELYQLEVLDVASCDIEDVRPLIDLVSSSQSQMKQIDLSRNPDVCEHHSLPELQAICDEKSVLLWTDCLD